MATPEENKNTGIKRKGNKVDETRRELTSVVEKQPRKQKGDAEAGVDPQVDQLNDMPNDPHENPKEKVTKEGEENIKSKKTGL